MRGYDIIIDVNLNYGYSVAQNKICLWMPMVNGNDIK